MALAVAAGCSRNKQRESLRGNITVLRFDNLSSQRALDWMGRAVAQQFASQLDGVAVAQHDSGGIRASAIARGAKHLLHGYIAQTPHGLRLHAEIETPAKHALQSWDAEGAAISALCDSIARRIDPAARSFSTKSDEALKAYAEALEAPDPPTAASSFQRAITADPNFGLPYVALVQLALNQ